MAIWNETVSFYLIPFEEFAMPGWDEASVDELMADPIVRDLMAADGVDPGELRALLYGVQRTIERYATSSGGPASLVGFAQRVSSAPGAAPSVAPSVASRADRARPAPPTNPAGRSDVRKTRIALADYSRSSLSPLGCMFGGKTPCTAGS
jgi:hypothetical protein